MRDPTVIEHTHESQTNAARARWWRLHGAHLTVVELASITGYSGAAIYRLERGYNSNGRPFNTAVWKRYFRSLDAISRAKGIMGPCES